jgi:PTH1 family peptidyl-tRNA hydrolase
VEFLAGSGLWISEKTFDYAEVTIRSRPVTLVKPTTSMNDSGVGLHDVMARSSAKLSDLVVLVDDINLDVGRIRIRRSGSDGGHNGLRSIILSLADDGFGRVRLGVGKVPEGVSQIDHVLGRFGSDHLDIASDVIRRSAEAIRTWCADGVELSMNLFNSR